MNYDVWCYEKDKCQDVGNICASIISYLHVNATLKIDLQLYSSFVTYTNNNNKISMNNSELFSVTADANIYRLVLMI